MLVAAPAALPTTGGVTYVPHPKITSVHCSSGCESHGRVLTGGTLTIRGSGLSTAKRVVFLGGSGKSDDVSVGVTPSGDSKRAVQVSFHVESRVADQIRQDSVATLEVEGLLGQRFIDVTRGTTAKAQIPSGGEVPFKSQPRRSR